MYIILYIHASNRLQSQKETGSGNQRQPLEIALWGKVR